MTTTAASHPPPLTIGWRAKLAILALVAGALLFAIYGPEHPKGITFSGPLTMLIIAFVIWRIADWRMNRAVWRWRYAQPARDVRSDDLFGMDPLSASAGHAGDHGGYSEDEMNAFIIHQRQWGRL